MFSVTKLLPVQLSALCRYGKQMLEMFVAWRWSGMKPRSSDYRPTGDQRRPGEGFCVGLAATGSTACNDNAIQKTRGMIKKKPSSDWDWLGAREDSQLSERIPPLFYFPLRKWSKQESELMTDFLSKVCQRLKGRRRFYFFPLFHVWSRSASELIFLTVWSIGFPLWLYRLS